MFLAAKACALDELSSARLSFGLGNGTRWMISGGAGGLEYSGAAHGGAGRATVAQRGLGHHEGRFYRCRIAALDQFTERPAGEIPIFTACVNPRIIESACRVAAQLLGEHDVEPAVHRRVCGRRDRRAPAHAGPNPAEVAFTAKVLASVSDDEKLACQNAAAMIR